MVMESKPITVEYGVHSLVADAVGKTIADVRAALAQPLNMDGKTYAVINGRKVSEDYTVKPNDLTIEFIKEAGIKGGAQWTDADECGVPADTFEHVDPIGDARKHERNLVLERLSQALPPAYGDEQADYLAQVVNIIEDLRKGGVA